MYDISSPLLLSCKNGLDSHFRAPLSLDCSFTDGQLAGITACAEAYHLFCVPSLKIEDMEALFACKDGFCIRVNNVRHVTVMFDALLENRFIQYHWQSVLEKGKFLLCKNGKYFVSASNLSTALSAARRNPDSVFYGIQKAIKELEQ
ncbi:hypothetical protein QUW17_05355 [Bacteroides gallinaceum]|nr:hypothetical protein [Bacteroides gallinaceum]MDM8207307.1 hypothetical protein [Bacteroides gallinaceum]